MVHCTNRQKHSKPLVYKSSQVYQDCTNSVPIVKNSQNSTKMTTGVPVVTCLPRLYQPCTNSVPKTKDTQNSKNDHWCTNRHSSTKTVQTFSVKEWPDLEIWVWGPSRSLRMARFDVFLTAGARAYQKHVLHGPETVSIFKLHWSVTFAIILTVVLRPSHVARLRAALNRATTTVNRHHSLS